MSTDAQGESQQLSDRRRRRLREELEDAGLTLPDDHRLSPLIIAELDYARFPPIHEASTPSFGALLVDSDEPPESIVEHISPIDIHDIDLLRSLADGRHSFVLRTPNRCGLLLFEVAHDRESDLVNLRSRSDAVIVQRIVDGTVRLLTPENLWIWDGTHWWSKDYATSCEQAILAALPEAPIDLLRDILDFCVHTMSPADAGAAFIWFLEPPEGGRIPGLSPNQSPIAIPELGLGDIASRAAIRQFMSHMDGAAILDRDGRLVAVGAHLRSTRRSHEMVSLDPRHGTRHASARRYTFDHEATVAFVVSRDGPVTMYAGGSEITVIGRDRSPMSDPPVPTSNLPRRADQPHPDPEARREETSA